MEVSQPQDDDVPAGVCTNCGEVTGSEKKTCRRCQQKLYNSNRYKPLIKSPNSARTVRTNRSKRPRKYSAEGMPPANHMNRTRQGQGPTRGQITMSHNHNGLESDTSIQMATRESVKAKWSDRFKSEFDGVMNFWLKHSIDTEHGGFFNCLDVDGKVYDTRKHVWLQGRQVWMFSKIARDTPVDDESRSELIAAARGGLDFLRKTCRPADNRVYFCVNREGEPLELQRKLFSECFYIMAINEFAHLTTDEAERMSLRDEALSVFESVWSWIQDPSPLGRPQLSGQQATSSLAIPMITLNLLTELRQPFEGSPLHENTHGLDFDAISKWCTIQIDKHIHFELEPPVVLETVGQDGKPLLDTYDGRLINPGHAIEAGWFLLQHAENSNDDSLRQTALKMIDVSFDIGWDNQYGGIYYFLDCKNYSPIQLEWDMKLWWPHCEALIAFLMAYRTTGNDRYLMLFDQVAKYSFEHFSDPENGEWFGYLNRQGMVTHRFKGGPYKGCFHVPRALWMCLKLLSEL